MKSDPAYVILCREVPVSPGVSAYELKSLGQVPQAVLKHMANAGRSEGFQLMFEFGSEPDMEEVQAACESGAGISSMPGMVQLWVLTPEDLECERCEANELPNCPH